MLPALKNWHSCSNLPVTYSLIFEQQKHCRHGTTRSHRRLLPHSFASEMSVSPRTYHQWSDSVSPAISSPNSASNSAQKDSGMSAVAMSLRCGHASSSVVVKAGGRQAHTRALHHRSLKIRNLPHSVDLIGRAAPDNAGRHLRVLHGPLHAHPCPPMPTPTGLFGSAPHLTSPAGTHSVLGFEAKRIRQHLCSF